MSGSAPRARRFLLRKAQIEAMRQAAEPAFVEEVAAHLRENNTDAVAKLKDPELERRIGIGLKRARRHELTEKATLTMFVAFMFEIAPNFDESAPVKSLLEDKTKTPDERMRELPDQLTDEQWMEVKANADPKVWEAGQK
jgi:hypothetical protein